MRKSLLIILALLGCRQATVSAQDQPEYRMEIGVGGGAMGYLGDFNGNLLKDLQPMGGVFARYNLNPYMGFRLDASYGKIKGTSKGVETYYPPYADVTYDFNNSLVDISLTYEYNFWPYGTGRDYHGAQRLTPFIFAGFGLTYVNVKGGETKNVFTGNMPLGVGIKYKMSDRVNVGVDWAMHFSLSDKLDGVKDPYFVKSSGAFKNTECYSTLQVTVSYSFWARCRVCHNEDE